MCTKKKMPSAGCTSQPRRARSPFLPLLLPQPKKPPFAPNIHVGNLFIFPPFFYLFSLTPFPASPIPVNITIQLEISLSIFFYHLFLICVSVACRLDLTLTRP